MTNPYPIKPAIQQRPVNQQIFNEAIQEGFSPIPARVIASREIDSKARTVTQAIKPKLRDIASPLALKDIEKAVNRLVEAKHNSERISLAVDFDADGQTSLAILYRGLTMLGFEPSNLIVHCSHRLREGYGLNDKLVDRILERDRPSLIVTADNGSSNAKEIERLSAEGIDVIVTDHHALLEGPPPHAYAVINPIRSDCEFHDKSIAGCSVAFMLLIALRQSLLALGEIDKTLSIAPLLTFSGVGVQADCVHLGNSMTNRAMVRYAISAIQKGSPYPCWNALKSLGRSKVIDSEFLSFTVAPAINAAGRLDEAKHAGNLFITDDVNEAISHVNTLKVLNESRKDIERSMTKLAKQIISQKYNESMLSLCALLEEGNPGVIGIVSSRITQKYGKPSCILAPTVDDPTILTGSLRSVDSYSIKEGIKYINEAYPDLLERGGGHDKAGGVSFPRSKTHEFEEAFESSVRRQTDSSTLVPRIETDGFLPPKEMTLELVRAIADLQPFGQGFPKPSFEGKGRLIEYRLVGSPKVHAQLRLNFEGKEVKGIWFSAIEQEGDNLKLTVGELYRIIFTLDENTFNNRTNMQINVVYIESLMN
ncbi:MULTISPECIES: single-stranded-DNA-specific exonuclease RecJ [Idiomarina]|uniref:single-stranded-DNA-specific exonuclease RecJ n=1 Tax=Idiomarina TaxID=135575 RepID=UPI000C68ABC7|nr:MULTISPECIES: single-stranded-DNA-specific exonuclease RecJ [Idiomarina]MBP58011.1 single-stranded-DNA-specific exonuclease RecJ [Idiomarina sp.]|tara:strand:+ start:31367 stop:33148 length:1782 start_codon:yes stop_codon:yes gene_type:complete